MTDKKTILKPQNTNVNSFYTPLVEKKIEFFKNIIEKTVLHIYKNKFLDILGISDVNSCIDKLSEISKKIEEIKSKKLNNDTLLNYLQIINNELSSVLKNYGTDSLEDLLLICFGNNNNFITTEKEKIKLDILKKYFHPTSYKLANKKEDNNHEKILNLSCYDISSSYKQYHMKVYGIKILIHNNVLKKTLIIFGVVDDIIIEFLNNNSIQERRRLIKEKIPESIKNTSDSFDKFISSLTLKDFLIYENDHDIYAKYTGYISKNNSLIQKQISHVVKEFISDDLYVKRNTIINLLIFSSNYENQYLAYLLYDLLSNDSNGNIDTQEQIIMFDSFPWHIKQFFKQAMKKTIQYTNELSNFDFNKIPLEQQICLLKANDTVKEKAMTKLKELKAKSEDSGTKARQYLDCLLKIPFTIYKKEPILNTMSTIKRQFESLYKKYNIEKTNLEIPYKENYTSIEIFKYIKTIQGEEKINSNLQEDCEELSKIEKKILVGDKKQLHDCIMLISKLFKKYNMIDEKKYSNMNKECLKNEIRKFIEICKIKENYELRKDVFKTLNMITFNLPIVTIHNLHEDIGDIYKNMNNITNYISDVKNILDTAVHGHDKVKKQIEKIIGQWINGEQDGYCLGFEGAPGLGKTTLAKRGIANCLKDENGVSRPFAMIQMGGDSNGSTLHGHNYTYVGSSWGSILQILIDKKCMNPIIFIDEVDKISKTEHGREIVGILTHLLDSAQNDCFQDKYFTGIDLDLSKALFILSYNDADAIDKILLDRVHRIKFSNLTLEDKLIICNKHLLPEIYRKMGLEDIIFFDNETLKFVIDEYTLESGVRKLKEILFEIIGEINLDILKNNKGDLKFPINITIDDIKNNYFKDKKELTIRKVPEESLVGFANGMYATSLGNGGTLPIHAKFFPSEHFLELKLTGLQQDVMKESMHVSLTIAWNLTSQDKRKEIRELYDGENNKYGINIHPGDASVHKDGPSAGVTITSVIYSLLNNKPIKPRIAMTGEIQMTGAITAIGGLNYKILGSIKANVNTFIYPKENKKEFDEFYEKYKDDKILEGIVFHSVDHINEVFEIIFE
jgi:ATP-dependent Lon protease